MPIYISTSDFLPFFPFISNNNSLFSGGIAGTIASCITNPLEVVKTQLQSSSTSVTAHGQLASAAGNPVAIATTIFEKDGIFGFFRGLKPTLVGIIPARSAYFYAYESSKRALGPILPEGSIPNALISGLAAGVAGEGSVRHLYMDDQQTNQSYLYSYSCNKQQQEGVV